MSWDELKAYICNLESENADLQQKLATANSYIEHMEDSER